VKQLETTATSGRTASCNPIVLREGEQVRLVFLPAIVDNRTNPNACVDGQFVYQRKARSGRWNPIPTIPLSSLKAGDEFKLTVHAQELLTLLEGLVPLYRLHRAHGVPRGRRRFVEVDGTMANFIALGEKDLTSIFESQPDHAAQLLLKLVRWLATSAGRREAAEKLASRAPEQMPTFTAVLGLASLKDALLHWNENRNNSSEEFWQQSFAKRSYVLSQVFAYPIVVIAAKAYVGGKQISNKGGKEVDFLLATESTDAIILVEIKTPQTKLLGEEYRSGVFPLSRELSAAVAQALRYRQSVMRKFDSIMAEHPNRLILGEPRCIVIAGQTDQLTSDIMRENFELQRERVHGVVVITYDELFVRLQ